MIRQPRTCVENCKTMKSDPPIPVPRRLCIPQLAFVALFLFLATRAAWRASHAETGWEVIRHDWGRTLAAWTHIDKPTLAAREPVEQARFWLREVDRLRSLKSSPDGAAGAAWMLDAPQSGYLQNHYRANPANRGIPGLPLQAYLELDLGGVARATDEFEDLCHERCMDWIERATRVDPENVNLWRTRALLLFRSNFAGLDLRPRRVDWQAVLDECSGHDADNALYDYLAAVAEWNKATVHRWEKAGYVLEVRDEDGYERGNRRFAAGLEEPGLMFGSSGYVDAWAFLKYSALSPLDRLAAGESCQLGARANKLPYALVRWQIHQQSAQRREGEFAVAAATLRDTLRIAQQISAKGNPSRFAAEPLMIRRFALANLVELAAAAPGLFDKDELLTIEANRRDVRLQLAILEKVDERMEAAERSGRSLSGAASVVLAEIGQPLSEAVLLLAVCFAIVARICANRPAADVEAARIPAHIVAWVVGIGLSYVVFGLCPVEIISARVQTWVVRGVVAMPLGFALIGAFFVLYRKFRAGALQLLALSVTFVLLWVAFSYQAAVPDLVLAIFGSLAPWATLLTTFAVLGAGWWVFKTDLTFLRRGDLSSRDKIRLAFFVQALAAFTVPWGPTVSQLAETYLKSKCWVPQLAGNEARALGIVPADLASVTTDHPWLSSLLQWQAYHGLWFGLLLSLLFSTVIVMLNLSRSSAGGLLWVMRHQKVACLRRVITASARFLVVAGLFAMVVYLAAVPAVIEEREAYYRRHLSRLLDAEAARQEIEAEIAAIRNNAAIMAELHQNSDAHP
jgi:hypothetical protein